MRTQLEATLTGFVVERELGGGGMSHVYLAREEALDRQVVVKVLPPALAGASLERFRREIQLAAGLQHPHIVPVLTAGEAGDFLYYTMPYIAGESLRARLDAGHPVPVAEAVRVLRDVAGALAYAHERGVVHRDVKPDNVLMSGGHAVVTDFGVAKAVAAAAGDRPERVEASAPSDGDAPASANRVITLVGVAVGTPAYMAPEQAAGDPDTDHRADIYALGLLGYELLTGQSPFAHHVTPHELITAQLVERPRDLAEVRPELSPALAALVMRCLEKQPEHRPASAAAVRDAFDAVLTPSGGHTLAGRRPMRRRRLVFATAAAIVSIAGGTLLLRGRVAKPLDPDLVAVVPFDARGASTDLRHLREGMLDLFAARLTGDAGSARAADPRAVLEALRRAGADDTTALARDRALALAERVGAGQLLLGDVSGTAQRITLHATLLDVRDGRMRAQGDVVGPADSLPGLVDRLAVQLLAIRAGQGARLASLTSQSFPAIRAYLAGLALYRRGRYQQAGAEFTRALAEDSTFALAGLGLNQSANWYGDPNAVNEGSRLAWQSRARLSPRDLALLEATLGPHFPAPPNSAEIIATRRRYLGLAPERAEAWFEYGDALFHFGATVGDRGAHVAAAEAFGRALAIDSGYVPALEHLVLLAARSGDTAATRRYATLYLRADSLGEGADGVRWRLAVASGDRATLDRLAAKGATLAPSSRSVVAWVGLQDGVEVERSHALLTRIGEQETREGHPESFLMMADVALMRGRPRAAEAMIAQFEAARGPAPLERIKAALVADGSAEAGDAAAAQLAAAYESNGGVPGWPQGAAGTGRTVGVQCLVPLWRVVEHSDTSHVRRAVGRLHAAVAKEAPGSALAEYANGCAALLDAALALEQRAPDARARVAHADSLLLIGPASGLLDFGNLVVARLWEAAGDNRHALAAVRRRPFFYRRAFYLGAALREEGRLAAVTGDPQGAATAWRHFLALRAGAEPALAREAEGVRTELARLDRGERRPQS